MSNWIHSSAVKSSGGFVRETQADIGRGTEEIEAVGRYQVMIVIIKQICSTQAIVVTTEAVMLLLPTKPLSRYAWSLLTGNSILKYST